MGSMALEVGGGVVGEQKKKHSYASIYMLACTYICVHTCTYTYLKYSVCKQPICGSNEMVLHPLTDDANV